jgi:hypothetical protein
VEAEVQVEKTNGKGSTLVLSGNNGYSKIESWKPVFTVMGHKQHGWSIRD